VSEAATEVVRCSCDVRLMNSMEIPRRITRGEFGRENASGLEQSCSRLRSVSVRAAPRVMIFERVTVASARLKYLTT